MYEKLSKENQEQFAVLRQWVDSQPYFPKNISDNLVIRFLHSNYYNLEEAKTNAEEFFSIRASAAYLLTERDPLSMRIQKALKTIKLAQIPISGNRNLWIWQFDDPTFQNYDYEDDAMLYFLSTDAFLLTSKNLQEEDIVIFDFKGLSFKFLTKFKLSVAKILTSYNETLRSIYLCKHLHSPDELRDITPKKILQLLADARNAIPIRLNKIHILNAPSVIYSLFSLLKPFLKQDMTEKLHFHTAKTQAIFNEFTKEDLPSDYGGTQKSLSEYMVDTTQLILSQRNFFLDDTNWMRIKEDKQSERKTMEKKVTTPFCTLDID